MASFSSELPLEEILLQLLQKTVFEAERVLLWEEDLFEAGMESMGIMQLILQIEERFGVEVGDAEVKRANFESISALAAMVKRLRQGSQK